MVFFGGFVGICVVALVMAVSLSRLKPSSDYLPLFHMTLHYHLFDRICYSGALISLIISILGGILMVWLPNQSEIIGKVSFTGFLLLILFTVVLFLNKAIRSAGSPDAKK